MKTARCLRCGLTMKIRSYVPKACPACGFDSKAEMERRKAAAKPKLKPRPVLAQAPVTASEIMEIRREANERCARLAEPVVAPLLTRLKNIISKMTGGSGS